LFKAQEVYGRWPWDIVYGTETRARRREGRRRRRRRVRRYIGGKLLKVINLPG
jgi:hypothetical protein